MSKTKKMDSKNNDNEKKKENNEDPIIIRRAVIVDTDKNKENNKAKATRSSNSDLGKIQRSKNQDYNIVYREKTSKPLSVSELFGFAKKEKVEEKEEKKVERYVEVAETKAPLSLEKLASKKRTDQKEGFRKRENRSAESNNFRDRKHRAFSNTRVQVTPNIDIPEFDAKEMQRDRREKEREREKQNQNQNTNDDRRTRASRNREDFDEIDERKLDMLKRGTNLSEMFKSGQILDFYDVSSTKRKRRDSRYKKEAKQKKKQELEKASKLEKVYIPDVISVKEFAKTIKKTAAEVLGKLLSLRCCNNNKF